MDEVKKLNLSRHKTQKKLENIFFIGIGGIGMSALALYTKKNGYNVSGSDKILKDNNAIYLLKKANISLFNEENVTKELIEKADIIVITNTISNTHSLYLLALKLNKKILYRSQFLSQLILHKKTIGITGSHGKTTTTGITAHIFKKSFKKPTVFVGGIMKNYKKNLLIGNSEYLIIEADDAYKSFLDLNPFISIITSISYEHLETYKDLNNIEAAFLEYAEKTSKAGMVIINNDTEFLKQFINKVNHPSIMTYGTNNDADYIIKNIIFKNNKSYFSLFHKEKFLNNYSINLLGLHNIKNATASIIIALNTGIKEIDIQNALQSYKGIERRFQYKGKYNKINVYDDYAHHPVEIDAVLSILQIKKIQAHIFFQPHKYIRTKYLWNDFISVFLKYKNNIKSLYIVDVYAIEEAYDETYNSKNLVELLKREIKNIIYIPFDPEFKNLLYYKKNLINTDSNNTIILTLGAGVMNQFANILTKQN